VIPGGRAVDITEAAVEVAAADIAGEDILTVVCDNSEPEGLSLDPRLPSMNTQVHVRSWGRLVYIRWRLHLSGTGRDGLRSITPRAYRSAAPSEASRCKKCPSVCLKIASWAPAEAAGVLVGVLHGMNMRNRSAHMPQHESMIDSQNGVKGRHRLQMGKCACAVFLEAWLFAIS
jgi:hypothetical protein